MLIMMASRIFYAAEWNVKGTFDSMSEVYTSEKHKVGFISDNQIGIQDDQDLDEVLRRTSNQSKRTYEGRGVVMNIKYGGQRTEFTGAHFLIGCNYQPQVFCGYNEDAKAYRDRFAILHF